MIMNTPAKEHKMKLNDNIVYSPEVAEAIKNDMPVIAMESTIISHGIFIRNIHS